jgi:hypothetical protein
MQILYALLWGSSVWAVLAMFFGLPLWLLMGAGTYVASLRSRNAANAAGTDSAKPEVSRFAKPAKIMSFIAMGTIAASALAYLLGPQLLLAGPLTGTLEGISIALYFLAPWFLMGLAVLSVASVFDILVGRRVAGKDTAIAYLTVIAMEAGALALWAAGVVHGEQVM